MKTLRCGRALYLAVGVLLTTRAAFAGDDVVIPAVTNLVAATRIEAPRLADTVPATTPVATAAVTLKQPALTLAPEAEPAASAESAAEEPLTVVAAAAGIDTLGAPKPKPQEDAQRRLETPTPEKLIERHGTIGFLIRQPEARNFLDVINPFAPVNYGPNMRETYNRDRNLKPGAVLPRTFVNDITHEPDLNLFNWPW